MADLLTSSQSQTTTAPQFYTDYLTNLASSGKTATDNAQFADVNPNQQAAFNMAGSNVGNYQPQLNAAVNTAGNAVNSAGNISSAANPYLQAGTQTSGLSQANPYLQQGTAGADQLVQNYMNPYVNDVVNQIGALNKQNIQQNLTPGVNAGAIGAGQFGSQRGTNALALGIANQNLGALGQQATALQSGYAQALQAAQQQRANQLTAGSTAGQLQNASNVNQINAAQAAAAAQAQQAQQQLAGSSQQSQLAGQQQQLGLNQMNALATMGGQQQAIEQNKQLFPLQKLGLQAGLLQGQSIPMSTTQTSQASPLSTIAGLTAGGIGVLNNISGIKSGLTSLKDLFSGFGGTDPNAAANNAYSGNSSNVENIGT